MSKKPFFNNISNYKCLYVDKILFEYDFYSYYILIDDQNNYFISYCYEVDEKQSWIINKVDIKELIEFLENKIDIRSIFLYNESKKIIITRSYEDEKENDIEISNDDIIKMDILPDKDVFIEIDLSEYEEYIKNLYKKEKIIIKQQDEVYTLPYKHVFAAPLLSERRLNKIEKQKISFEQTNKKSVNYYKIKEDDTIYHSKIEASIVCCSLVSRQFTIASIQSNIVKNLLKQFFTKKNRSLEKHSINKNKYRINSNDKYKRRFCELHNK